jgi:hypothetical protein
MVHDQQNATAIAANNDRNIKMQKKTGLSKLID